MRLVAIAPAAILAASFGVVFASPASAAGTAVPGTIYVQNGGGTCANNSGFNTGPNGSGSNLVAFGPPGISAGTGDTITVTNECAVTVYINTGSISPGSWTALAGGATSTFTITNNGATFQAYATNTFGGGTVATTGVSGVYQGGGSTPGGGSSSSSTSNTSTLETLTLQVSTGDTTCIGGSPTGYTGSWLQLPAADACSQTGPNANPNARLLGWATDPIFPVSVAQQIVDLKYGPIDDNFYGMRMIFIPAGGWTFVSGSNNLYPIWSN